MFIIFDFKNKYMTVKDAYIGNNPVVFASKVFLKMKEDADKHNVNFEENDAVVLAKLIASNGCANISFYEENEFYGTTDFD